MDVECVFLPVCSNFITIIGAKFIWSLNFSIWRRKIERRHMHRLMMSLKATVYCTVDILLLETDTLVYQELCRGCKLTRF